MMLYANFFEFLLRSYKYGMQINTSVQYTNGHFKILGKSRQRSKSLPTIFETFFSQVRNSHPHFRTLGKSQPEKEKNLQINSLKHKLISHPKAVFHQNRFA